MLVFYNRNIEEVWICESVSEFVKLYNEQYFDEWKWEPSYFKNCVSLMSAKRRSSIVWYFQELKENTCHKFETNS